MLRGIYTGASGMSAMQIKMDTVANNLANVSTPITADVQSSAAVAGRGGTLRPSS